MSVIPITINTISPKGATPRKAQTLIDRDAALCRRLGQSDHAALAQLMERHMGKIHAAAYRMLGDSARAEDVTQMVFLQMWKIAPEWEYKRGSVLAYLYKTATHRCLDILRKSKEALPGTLPDHPDNRPNALEHMTRQDEARAVKDALQKLPDRQRAALTLFYYQHQSLKDAAKIMDITPTAFESLLRRARQNMKPLLSPVEMDMETSS